MLGSIISAVGNLAGGLFNANKQEKFAKNSLGWKVEDAERHGISKYFAVGAPTTSFSPVNIGGGLDNLGSQIDQRMGQGGPGSTTTGKVGGINSEIQRAQLDGLRIDNDIKRAELAAKSNIALQPGAGGVLDRDTTMGPNGVKLENKIAPSGYGVGQKSFGVSPEVDMYKTVSGGYAPQVPQQLQEAFENDWMSLWQWRARNKLLPFMYDQYKTAPYEAPSNSYWYFDPVLGEYKLVKKRGGVHDYGSVEEAWRNINKSLRR